MSKVKDLKGKRFGRLVVINQVDSNKEGRAQWLCQCDLTIDRIDVNGNYEPNNCCWATWHVQRLNKRKKVI